MIRYKHTQIGYFMIVVTFIVTVLFGWMQITIRAETPSVDSGTNFLFTSIMVLIVLALASFATLSVSVDDSHLKIKFSYGVFKKKFPLGEIVSVKTVKNHWSYGWGIRLWLWPKMWIYNVSGFDAVEIVLKNGRVYRIGTDEPERLEVAIRQVLNS